MPAPPFGTHDGPARAASFSCPLAPHRGALSTMAPWLVAMALSAAIACFAAPSVGGVQPSDPPFVASVGVAVLGLVVTAVRAAIKPAPTHAVEIAGDRVAVVPLTGGAPLLAGSLAALGVEPAHKVYPGRVTAVMPVVRVGGAVGKPLSIGAPDFGGGWSIETQRCGAPRFVTSIAEWPGLVAALGLARVSGRAEV
jgi:hypothetical protein